MIWWVLEPNPMDTQTALYNQQTSQFFSFPFAVKFLENVCFHRLQFCSSHILSSLFCPGWLSPLKLLFIFFPFICISWRLITLQYCSGFCHTLTWIRHGFTCVPHPDPPSHRPPHPIPLIRVTLLSNLKCWCQWTIQRAHLIYIPMYLTPWSPLSLKLTCLLWGHHTPGFLCSFLSPPPFWGCVPSNSGVS